MAIDRTPEEQEEYNRLKKDIIKDIKKETRKKDYNSSNKNTTSNSLTDIVKSRREAGEGVFSSLGGAAKEQLKEKLDIRRALPQGGLLTALFPKLKAYKAQQLNPQSSESAGVGAAPAGGGDSLSSSKSLLDSISVSTKIISKNSMALPLIQKDTNLMRQTLKKIVKAMQIRRKVNPFAKKTNAILSKSYSAGEAPGQLESEKEEPKKEKNPIEKLLESIKETFSNLPKAIVSGILYGFKGLFAIAKFASSFLLGLLSPLLVFIFSKAGIALILASGIVAAIYALYKLKPTKEELDQRSLDVNAIQLGYDTGAIKYSNILDKQTASVRLSTGLFNDKERNYLKEREAGNLNSPIGVRPEVTGATQSVSGTIAVGDSIAVGLINSGTVTGTIGKDASVGKNTSGVLKMIEDNLSTDKDYYKLKHVALSTGISNSVNMSDGKVNPSAYMDIEKQITELVKAGASVTVLGTGPNKAYEGIDEILEKITGSYGNQTVKFRPIASAKDKGVLGQITPSREFAADRVHLNAESSKNLGSSLAASTPKMFNAGIAQVAAVATGGGVPAGTDGQNDQSFLTSGPQNDGPSNTISTPVPSARPAVPPEASGGTIGTGGIDEIRELIKSNENLMSAQDGPGQNQGFIGRRINSPLPAHNPVLESLTNASIVKLAYGHE
jgi:hypothetical protein